MYGIFTCCANLSSYYTHNSATNKPIVWGLSSQSGSPFRNPSKNNAHLASVSPLSPSTEFSDYIINTLHMYMVYQYVVYSKVPMLSNYNLAYTYTIYGGMVKPHGDVHQQNDCIFAKIFYWLYAQKIQHWGSMRISSLHCVYFKMRWLSLGKQCCYRVINL